MFRLRTGETYGVIPNVERQLSTVGVLEIHVGFEGKSYIHHVYSESRGEDSCKDSSGGPLLVFFPVNPRPHYMGTVLVQKTEKVGLYQHVTVLVQKRK